MTAITDREPLLFQPLGVRHLSPSQLDLFVRCPEAWRYRYIEKHPEKASGALVVGGAAHHALAHYFRHLHAEKKRMEEAQLLTSFSQDFDKRASKESDIDWGDDERKNPLDAGRTKDRGVVALRAFSKELLPAINPMAVECRVKRAIPGTDIDLMGYIDILEARAIRDHKFSGRMKSEDDAHRSHQLSAYAWMVGRPHEGDEFEVSLEVATFGGKAKRLKSIRTPAQLAFYEEHILGRVVAALHHCLKSGNFPCLSEGWLCSEKWCSFWKECIGKTWKGA